MLNLFGEHMIQHLKTQWIQDGSGLRFLKFHRLHYLFTNVFQLCYIELLMCSRWNTKFFVCMHVRQITRPKPCKLFHEQFMVLGAPLDSGKNPMAITNLDP